MAAAELMARQQPPQSSDLQMFMGSLYVGDLSPSVVEVDLMETFGEMGDIASIRVCRDLVSGKSLSYGYVNFFTHAHASKALACLNHKTVKGKPMRIMWSQRNPLRRKTGVGNLYVKNLSPLISSARLESIFCKFGTILSCKVAEENGRSKGFGFVQFDKEESAMEALNSLNNALIEGQKMYVSKFVKKTPAQRMPYEGLTFTNLYVKNLPEEITEDHLQQKFSELGKVTSTLIIKDKEGKPKGYGFVNFETSEAAKKAIESLNGSLMGSKAIFVARAQTKEERERLAPKEAANFSDGRNACNLYVKNLDLAVNDQVLREYFSSFGIITSVKVMVDNNGLSKGFGFVCFSTPEEAWMAQYKLNGTKFYGKVLYVALAQRKEDRVRSLQNYFPQQQPNLSQSSLNPYVNYYYPLPYPNFPVYTIPHSENSQPVVYRVGTDSTFPLTENNIHRNQPTYYQQGPGIQTQLEGKNSMLWTSKIPAITYPTHATGGVYPSHLRPQKLGYWRKEYTTTMHNQPGVLITTVHDDAPPQITSMLLGKAT